jgi:hypothetical protein
MYNGLNIANKITITGWDQFSLNYSFSFLCNIDVFNKFYLFF